MLKSNKILFVALLASLNFLAISVNAQTNSPYSRYGLGALKDQTTGPSRGMGGVGYGLHTSQSANPLNPASYAQVDSLTFIFDIGVNYNSTSYKENGAKDTKSNGGLDYVTALFPLSKKLGLSFGILPFSSTGYRLGSVKTAKNELEDETTYHVLHDGSGGLSQVYLGLGYKLPIQGLTAGFNVSYLFGNLNYANELTGISEVGSYRTAERAKLNVTSVKFDLGLQYQMKLKDMSALTLGLVYNPKINGTGKLTRLQIDPDTRLVIKELYNGSINAGTPHMFGAGAIYNYKRRMLLGFDVKYENWKGVNYSDEMNDGLNSSNRFNNRWKFAAGAEYRVAEYSQNYFQKIKFRGGLNYSNSYVNVNTEDKKIKGYNEYGATLGIGLPLTDKDAVGGRTSYLNINFEYKYLRPEQKNMVSERFFGVSLNMNINELWFYQRKIR